MPPDAFDHLYRRVPAAEFRGVPYRAATFDIDGMFGELVGFTTGQRWNGWACPLFPRESCAALIERLPGAHFELARDAFLIPRVDAGPDDEDVEVYLPQMIVVDDQLVRVWAVGSGSWTWDETAPAGSRDPDPA
jgi:hypothetical protein